MHTLAWATRSTSCDQRCAASRRTSWSLLAEFWRFMSRLQEIATLPLDVVDDATPSRLRCRLMEINQGWRATKRARSVINDSASACFPSSGSVPA